jgi:hypothetical protein
MIGAGLDKSCLWDCADQTITDAPSHLSALLPIGRDQDGRQLLWRCVNPTFSMV